MMQRRDEVRGFFVALVVGAALMPTSASAQELYGRDDVLARAPLGMGADAVGRFYDSDFRPLVGGAQQIPHTPEQAAAVPVGYTRRDFRVVQTQAELQANASAWGVTGSVTAADASRHAYFRAYTIETMTALSDTVELPEVVPARAAYYVSAVFIGRLFEAHFTSRSTSGSISAGADGLVASGGIEAWASEQNLEVQIDGLGLEAIDDSALFAQTQSEVTRHYRASGEPRAIFVRFSRVPTARRASAPGATARYTIQLDQIVFPQIRPGYGTRWDAFGGDPDITVEVLLDGQRIYMPTNEGRDQLIRDFASERTQPGSSRVGIVPTQTLSASSSLAFHFVDVDTSWATSDDGGTLTVTGAQIAAIDGQTTLTCCGGVRLTLTVTRTE